MKTNFATIRNNFPVQTDKLQVLTPEEFKQSLANLLLKGNYLSAYFADKKEKQLYAVCSDIELGVLYILIGKVVSNEFISLTKEFPQAQLFEREIFEDTGFIPEGHPWLKPVRFSNGSKYKIGEQSFFKMNSDELHQVAVGPVNSTIFQIETAAGDTTIGHTTAYSQVIEYLSNRKVSVSDNIVRSIALELERSANHIGDIDALSGDAGFLPTQSYCGRIRGDFLNMTALLCGNRFERGLIVPEGIGYQFTESINNKLSLKIEKGLEEFLDASKLMFNNPSIVARFESIGNVSLKNSMDLGMVGPAARASGIVRDIRHDFAYGNYRFSSIPISTYTTGNVYGRAYLRWMEVQISVKYIQDQLLKLKQIDKYPTKEKASETPLLKNSLIVSLVEGWRGEICHVAITNSEGKFKKYKIYDPSFHNWFGLAQSLRNQQISDFPLCNKSFNLSYCGHDL